MKKHLVKTIMIGLLCASALPSVGEAQVIEITQDVEFNTDVSGNEVALDIVGNDSSNDIHVTIESPDTDGVGLWLSKNNNIELKISNNCNQNIIVQGGLLNITSGNDDLSAICNYGAKNLEFNNKVHISMYGAGRAIENYGNTNFNNELAIYNMEHPGELIFNGSGATLNINGGLYVGHAFETLKDIICNEGTLNIKAESDEKRIDIYGNITASSGSNTNITLGKHDWKYEEFDGIVGYLVDSNLQGAIKIEDGATVNLTINKSGVWLVPNSQESTIDNLKLNDGMVQLGWERSLAWGNSTNNIIGVDMDKWCTLKLTNLESTDKFTVGGFLVHTDLANNRGDKLEIISLSNNNPNLTIPVHIVDKLVYENQYDGSWNEENGKGIVNVNNLNLIAPSEGHSVTIVTSPVDSGLRINTDKVTYKSDNKVYKTIINEEIVDGWKNWNFVGWEATGEDNRDNKKAPQEAVEHSILVEDVEPIFKRFNDLRTDPSEIGVWVRGETGETKIRNLSYDHNIMSGGYDWDYKNDAGVLFAGVGFTYSTNECDDKAIGDTKGYGFNVYGSWLGKKNNDYVDLVVKYGKLDKSYAGYDENNIFVAGDYDKDLFTIAAKYGRRIFRDGWYYEPSVGLTWGRVGSADFTDNYGTRIHADNSYSNIASLGIQVGKNIKGIEYYGKAEVMHDFDGKIHVSAPGRSVEDDMGGTWVKCAIGASRKIDENNSFYLEVERDFGNKVEKPYGFSAGYRFTW